MTCLRINQSILKSCRNASPGVAEFYLCNYDSIYDSGSTGGIELNGTETKVVGITGVTESGYTSGFFYKFAVNRESTMFEDIAELNIPNGTCIYKPTLSAKFSTINEEVRTLFAQLSQATVIAIIKDREGKYFLVGKDHGLDMTSGSKVSTGTAATDFKGMEFTLEGLEKEPFIEIDTDAVSIASLIVSV